jgi:hypothetical protein
MRYVILLDGGFIKPKFASAYGHEPSATEVDDLATTPSYAPNMARLAALKRKDFFAVREGRLTCRGWKLRKSGIGKPMTSLSDSDFVPAIKLARRNGIQVFLFTLGHGVTPELLEHTDRLITSAANAV